jgi:uncharacterized repeat protein (TIGR01451 family)
LAPNSSQTIFVKINAPAGAPQGAANVLDVTIAPFFGADVSTTGSDTVTDTTIVVGGDIVMVKEWSLDGTSWFKGDGTDTSTPPQVEPGEDIQYRMTVTNIGTADVTAIEVFDSVPTFTDFVVASEGPSGDPDVTISCSTDGGSSYAACPTGSGTDTSLTTIQFEISDLAPGASKVLSFSVRVQ